MQNDEMFERTVKPVLDVNEKPQPAQWAFLSLQHLFAMFGATVLVPFLTGLPISAAFAHFGNRYITLYLNNEGPNTSILGI